MPAAFITLRPSAASASPSQAVTTGFSVDWITGNSALAVSSEVSLIVGTNSSSTPSLAGSSIRIFIASAKRPASASPMMSTGLPCDQVIGSVAFSRSSTSGDSLASCTPASTVASAASTPGPPPLVRMASRLPGMPLGRRPVASDSAAANIWLKASTRIAPARLSATSNTASLPTSAPVWLIAAFWPVMWRPTFSTTTGLTEAAARTLLMKARASCTPSTYSTMLRVAASIAR